MCGNSLELIRITRYFQFISFWHLSWLLIPLLMQLSGKALANLQSCSRMWKRPPLEDIWINKYIQRHFVVNTWKSFQEKPEALTPVVCKQSCQDSGMAHLLACWESASQFNYHQTSLFIWDVSVASVSFSHQNNFQCHSQIPNGLRKYVALCLDWCQPWG